MAKTKAIPAKFVDAEDLLHERAAALVGFEDFGNKDYLTGMRVLLNALDTDLELNPIGRERAFGSVLRALTGRLYSQKGWAEHPECLRTEIREPLVIVGLPRTGTTTLQKIMSLDPQFQGLEYWIAPNPMVRPPRDQWPDHPLYKNTVAGLEAADREEPMSRLIHDVAADDPDECLYMMLQRFVHNTFGASLGTPSYDEWWMAQDETPNYYRHRDNLKLVGMNDQPKRWLLRNISHLLYLDSLLEVFPDAHIIQTHRDPVAVIPSVCSLIMIGRRAVLGPEADPRACGRRENELWSIGIKRAMKVREQHPDRFYDVDFRDFVNDSIGVVRGIYRNFGLRLDDKVERKMRIWLDAHTQTRPGFHKYSPEQYGLSKEEIRGKYEDYIDHFHLA
ncbi:MAG TPA: sulfotransferase [Candidatus Binataceae bacterium]|nr:sulfotransferase [Candidatus Binataceae bacterium]